MQGGKQYRGKEDTTAQTAVQYCVTSCFWVCHTTKTNQDLRQAMMRMEDFFILLSKNESRLIKSPVCLSVCLCVYVSH
jgi:hypothetical protein